MIRSSVADHIRVVSSLDFGAVEAIARHLRDVLVAGRKILICGCGGSSSQASHLAAELVGRYVADRPGLAAIALNDPSTLTALVNDFGSGSMFSRQVEALGQEGDALVCLTTSGSSPSVVSAVIAARGQRMSVVGLTSRRGRRFAERECDYGLIAETESTARAQEVHGLAIHLICEVLDDGH